MYLLIPAMKAQRISYSLYLHPTMYLLILFRALCSPKADLIFTSHYVSINSRRVRKAEARCLDLHPTMYLLIRQ